MDRRRLVDPPGDGLEILDVEDPRIQEAVPAHHVERMEVEVVGRQLIARLDAHLELPALHVRLEPLRTADVALAVGRVLEQLPVLVPVAPRRLDLGHRFDDQEALVAGVHHHAVGGAARQDHVVAGPVGERAEDRLEASGSEVNEVQLVALAVPVEIVHARGGPTDGERDVGVPQQDLPRLDGIGAGPGVAGEQVMVAERLARGERNLRVAHFPDALHQGRSVVVIEQGAHAAETLAPHELLAEQRAVGLPELGVALVGDEPQGVIHGHGYIPPAPTDSPAAPALFRWPRTAP